VSTTGPEALDDIRRMILSGPDVGGPGRFGPITRLLRRLVGRTVKYERHYHHRIEWALLDLLEPVLAQIGKLSRLDDLEEHLDDVEARAAVAAGIATNVADMIDELRRELTETVATAGTQASVAASIASDVAERIAALGRDLAGAVTAAEALQEDCEKARFIYDELMSTPFTADPGVLSMTDADGRTTLGYRDGPGSTPMYAGFEDIFRGTSSFVRERCRAYLGQLQDRSPVLELGSGRGEMLSVLKDARVDARGVDADRDMVERARGLGVDVEYGDALEVLAKEADGSLGAIFSAQFVEHLSVEQLVELLKLAPTKLASDGVFIAETINPHSPRALKAFWVDPTHRHPLFPETLLALCRLSGFDAADIVFPFGRGDLANDRSRCGEYAVIARNGPER
jgi:SAM-dependent methyltransferase